jgi:type IV pilus assembly protein PilF
MQEKVQRVKWLNWQWIVAILIVTLPMTGCIQRTSYKNTGKPTTAPRIDTDEAAKTRIALGLQYLKVKEMSNAKYNLEKALRFAPSMPAVHTAFAYYYQQVDEDELAEKAYLKALSLDADDPNTLNNYGVFLCKVKRYEQSRKAFIKAIKVPSYLKVAESYENAAICAMEDQQYQQAKSYFLLSLDHSALRANTLVNMASLNYAMGDHIEAQKYTQRLTNIGVISPRVLLLRALVELKLGNTAQSKKYGTTLLSRYVKSPEALAYLSNKFDNTEFERLRKGYLKHQYKQFKATQKSNNLSTSTNVKKTLKSKPTESQLTARAIPKSIQQPTPKVTPAVGANESANTLDINVVKPHSLPQEVIVERNTGGATLTQLVATQPEIVGAGNSPLQPTEPMTTSSSTPDKPVVATIDHRVSANDKVLDAKVINKSVETAKSRSKGIKVSFHVVKKGEYLYDISVKYNIRLERLLQWNNLSKSDRLVVDQKVYLDNPNSYHIVEQGDTLYGISLKYNILLKRLLQWNDLDNKSRLNLGRKIYIKNPKT